MNTGGGSAFRGVLLGLMVIAAVGCGDDDAGGVDAGPTGVDAGPPVDGGGLPPGSEQALRALVEASTAAAALGGPLVPEAVMLRDDTRIDAPAMREMAARDRVEMGVSGNSIVTDPMCVAFAWSTLSVTITFTACTLEATGETLDGAVTLTVTFGPTEMALTFTSLQIGGTSIDGSVSVRTGGRCPMLMDTCLNCRDTDPTCMEMVAPQQTLSADITLTVGESFSISLTGATVMHDMTGTTVTGNGVITSSSVTATFDAMMLHWNMGECLPSSGTLLYVPGGGPMSTVGFLPTTPTTGNVTVTTPPFPTLTLPIFPPCGMVMP